MTDLNRRTFVQSLAGMGVAMQMKKMSAREAAPAHLNILYIHSHDSGRLLGPYGQPMDTPNLNKLAREGVLFRNAFSAAPTCSPSRAALLTGCYPHQNGMLGLAHLGFSLNNYKQHIAHTLRSAGYVSVLAGLQHIAANPEMIGYDLVLKPKSMKAADVAPNAAEFLSKKPAEPFFLDVGFFETHRKYHDPDLRDNPNYIQPPAGLPDTPSTRLDMAGYRSSARQLDAGIGQVLDALDRYGYKDNTLVISTTDHGIPFPEMKCSLKDAGWGVSLIMRGPGDFAPGAVCDAMVSHLDIFPTICELIGVEKPEWLQGESLLPVLRGKSEELHDEIFAEVNFHAAYEPKRAVRTKRWKYIRRYDGRTTAVLPNCDYGPSKQLWLDYGWQTEQLESDECLYDLIFDPMERNNLIHDPNHQQVLVEMRSRLVAWMKKTNDPLLRGALSAPPGTRLTFVDEINPKPVPSESLAN